MLATSEYSMQFVWTKCYTDVYISLDPCLSSDVNHYGKAMEQNPSPLPPPPPQHTHEPSDQRILAVKNGQWLTSYKPFQDEYSGSQKNRPPVNSI